MQAQAQAQVTITSATSDDTNVYYAISFTGSPTYRHVFIDVDRNAATGFKTGSLGAEFMIENNALYAYAGTGPDWNWKKVPGSIASVITATSATWTVPMSMLNYPSTVYVRAEVTPPMLESAVAVQVVRSRNPLQQPFASNSIWNTPIGTGAVYVPANLSAAWSGENGWDSMPQADRDYIFQAPSAPATDVYAQTSSWGADADRCKFSSTKLATVPIPADWTLPNASVPKNNGNDATAALMPDGHTFIQMQPVARCGVGTTMTAQELYNPPVDLYGPGITGAHGGSGLSAIGGSLRVGELRPNAHPPRHVLKVEVYSAEALSNCATSRASCFRWPAAKADSDATTPQVGYGTVANVNNTNAAMRMGALLAIPAFVDITQLGLETDPGRQLAWTLQNYGAYIVDSRGPGFTFATAEGTDGSKLAEFQNDYGFPFEDYVLHAGTSPWVRDVQRLVKALQVVDNNSATSIGGGGAPLQPLAPEIAP